MGIAVTDETRQITRRRASPEPWEQARRIDPTLDVSRCDLAALNRRRLRPVAFSRDVLFSCMARGEPVIFDDLPVPVRGEERVGVRAAVLRALMHGFPGDRKIRVRCGPSEQEKNLVIGELLRRWSGTSARVNVTDLHIRGTKVMQRIDCSRLSDFNILAEARGDVGAQEMLTMVVSSAGAATDSHSDDPDGSNHCFVGRKLWLVWDTFLGLSRGLEDVERCTVTARASFDIRRFLAIPLSRWFIVETGQTLFLPGHLTHKVVTLEDYLGVGSFFVMLPSYLRTLSRWIQNTPLWAIDGRPECRLELVDRITRRVTEKMHLLAHASQQERARWGVEYLYAAAKDWHRTCSSRK
jgi:hypothetical protein